MSADAREIIKLWPNTPPGSEGWVHPEEETEFQGIRIIRNVIHPTLTVFRPEGSVESGTGVIISPGGAWHILAIEMEGYDVAEWLAARGITSFVLKYRLIQTGADFPECIGKHLDDENAMRELMEQMQPLLLADSRRAIELVRERAETWSLNPDAIGMIGFSAGAANTVALCLDHDEPSKPNFGGAIYSAGGVDRPIPAGAPPLFILSAADDDMAAPISVDLYTKWREADHPAELHIYGSGGHGFGMQKRGKPSDRWIELFYDWLGTEGFA